MGRIKSALVKRTAEKLLEQYNFTDNFEENKKLIKDIMPSKRIRNKVAGYITKIVKRHYAKHKSLEKNNN